MVVNKADTFDTTPTFKDAQDAFQKGDWESGLKLLNKLVEVYPHDHNLRDYRQEMHLRSRVDKDEAGDIRKERRDRALIAVIRLSSVGLLLVILYIVWITYSSWLIKTEESLATQVADMRQEFELAVKVQQAQSFLQAGRSQEALALFEEVAAENPEFPGISQYINQTIDQNTKEARYSQAVTLMDGGDNASALPILQSIYSIDSNFKDVAERIEEIQRTQLLEETLIQANVAFLEERWTDAINLYGELRAIDADFETTHTEERLFHSYLNAAEALLDAPESTVEDLEQAEVYFRKALALRPRNEEVLNKWNEVRGSFQERLFWTHVNAAREALAGNTDSLLALEIAETEYQRALELRPGDEQIKQEFELAKNFLEAQAAFERADWDSSIEGMELVVSKDPGYALGVARHTLYESYLARADGEFATGEFVMALEDYQRAAVLSEQDQTSVMRLAEVQIKLGDVHGAIGNFEQAVLMYRLAVEVSNYRERIASENPALLSKIDEAERYAEARNFRPAFRLYNEALRGLDQVYETVVHKVVEGEYLTLIASRYHSTVSAILSVNDITNANKIYVGQEILVPVIP